MKPVATPTVQNAPGRDIRRLGVHHFADVTDLEVDAVALRFPLNQLEIRTLIDADLPGDDCTHSPSLQRAARRGQWTGSQNGRSALHSDGLGPYDRHDAHAPG